MSAVMTAPLRVFPSAANIGAAVPDGGINYSSYGPWTTVVPSLASPSVVAGVYLYNATTDRDFELQLGAGIAGSEVVLGTIRQYLKQTANGIHVAYLLTSPVSNVPAGRIAVRIRAVGGVTCSVGLCYYLASEFDSDYTLDYTVNPPTCTPFGAPMITVLPDATAWNSSPWVELTSSAPLKMGVFGMTLQVRPSFNGDWETDIGIGAGGSELVATTLRGATTNGPFETWELLPGIYAVAAGARVTYRLRYSGAGGSTWSAALLHYQDFPPAGAPEPPDVPIETETLGIRRLRQAPHLTVEQARTFFQKFQLDLETGVGLADGSDPQVCLQWSDDGGHTWQNEHWVGAGAIGQYTRRAIWRRLGVSRDRVFRVIAEDPVAWRLIAAYLDIAQGTN